MNENELSDILIGLAIKIHKSLGPGLLINFNVTVLKNGIKRVVNNLRFLCDLCENLASFAVSLFPLIVIKKRICGMPQIGIDFGRAELGIRVR